MKRIRLTEELIANVKPPSAEDDIEGVGITLKDSTVIRV
jgi:hypothetical protein